MPLWKFLCPVKRQSASRRKQTACVLCVSSVLEFRHRLSAYSKCPVCFRPPCVQSISQRQHRHHTASVCPLYVLKATDRIRPLCVPCIEISPPTFCVLQESFMFPSSTYPTSFHLLSALCMLSNNSAQQPAACRKCQPAPQSLFHAAAVSVRASWRKSHESHDSCKPDYFIQVGSIRAAAACHTRCRLIFTPHRTG